MHAPRDVRLRSLLPADAGGCDAIVHSLPYHFANEEGREQCAAAVRSHAGLAAVADDAVVGFLTWQPWFGYAWEITWLAVHAERRATGIGTLLVEQVGGLARAEGMRFLLVTTLSATVPEPDVADGYAQTRAFYEKRAFRPLWEPHGWWNEDNQALLMLRDLS